MEPCHKCGFQNDTLVEQCANCNYNLNWAATHLPPFNGTAEETWRLGEVLGGHILESKKSNNNFIFTKKPELAVSLPAQPKAQLTADGLSEQEKKLLDYLADDGEYLRRNAAIALGQLGNKDDFIINALLNVATQDTSLSVRQVARQSLITLGYPLPPEAIAFAESYLSPLNFWIGFGAWYLIAIFYSVFLFVSARWLSFVIFVTISPSMPVLSVLLLIFFAFNGNYYAFKGILVAYLLNGLLSVILVIFLGMEPNFGVFSLGVLLGLPIWFFYVLFSLFPVGVGWGRLS